ncbi:hypothetical protein [Rhodobium gokarnense]|uniref:Uncharacterized protein n=1 Tax=Rhodobium gokarnense TaxID=364296 RepID=A0ABT3HED1_9HYPH|nr:hypothetical protein [Rhodobium gokarnense]MCW2308684.1 hypothetical protein [Rhodobium gokarnense]
MTTRHTAIRALAGAALIAAPVALATTGPAQAGALSQVCRAYAKRAAAANEKNVSMRCGFQGNRWNASRQFHAHWCRTQNGDPRALRNQAQERRAQLRRCRADARRTGHERDGREHRGVLDLRDDHRADYGRPDYRGDRRRNHWSNREPDRHDDRGRHHRSDRGRDDWNDRGRGHRDDRGRHHRRDDDRARHDDRGRSMPHRTRGDDRRPGHMNPGGRPLLPRFGTDS